MTKWLRRTALILLVLGAALAAGSYAYLQHPKFGALPEGARLQSIERSPHYVNGEFRSAEASVSKQIATQVQGYVRSTPEIATDRARVRRTLVGREFEFGEERSGHRPPSVAERQVSAASFARSSKTLAKKKYQCTKHSPESTRKTSIRRAA